MLYDVRQCILTSLESNRVYLEQAITRALVRACSDELVKPCA